MSAPEFTARHVGPNDEDRARMLALLGFADLESFSSAVVPEAIRWRESLHLPEPATEHEALAELRGMAARNEVITSMIGLGYYGTITPGVILRNIMENPAWYTAYTPYQPEISQGRLEALLNFQTMVEDLTALPVAGSSLLDEPTAAAEAMGLALRQAKGRSRILVDADTHPQTLAVLQTRALPLDVSIDVADLDAGLPPGDYAGVLLSYPGTSGRVRDIAPLIEAAHAGGALAMVTTDLLALTLLTPPGELGADVVVGSAQRLGVPFGFGGPHAGFMSVRAGLERGLPGRLVGVSIDADGAPAYRLALQTREQHIRREKATSNICTAQVLLAVMASMYAVYHGPEGLRAIAERVRAQTNCLAAGLEMLGHRVQKSALFDTVRVWPKDGNAARTLQAALQKGINLRDFRDGSVGVTFDETVETEDLIDVFAAFGGSPLQLRIDGLAPELGSLARTSTFLQHPTFHRYRSEHELLRYIHRLQHKDLSLTTSMIPLGSCTMKLNATTEMYPVSLPGFGAIHPFAPLDQVKGYATMFDTLSKWLCEITGFAGCSLQPNAGSQGEYAGLSVIRACHRKSGQEQRNVCLIP
ncbi:MAG: glycine dehydrogenase (aminomethyl-transferring), partial [Actinomycetota bacterium]|nr:glycine dehydrogenase (aminomethyl-transferring) [Actinomycetota bacterium]